MQTQQQSLKQQWDNLKNEQPHVRIKNAAQILGVSEAELLATQINESVIRLKPEFSSILIDVVKLGKVMALTRNEECVHERKGIYLNPDFSSPYAGLFVGDDIDLRIFLNAWSKAFAVSEKSKAGERKSLQFFGKDGLAIHKIFLLKESDEEAFDLIVSKYKSDNQSNEEKIEEVSISHFQKLDTDIDISGFQKAWINLQDTHDFFGMLKKFEVTRTQALRLAPNDYFAKKIDKNTIVNMLEEVAAVKIPIMVFVGNRGNIQIHTGAIKKLMWHEKWFNVMDPDFNLHLDMSRIEETWLVRKPTADGIVTSIEVFNNSGELIVQFFGKRKPGIPELEKWREILAKY